MLEYKLVIVDLDGVLWRGREPIEENIKGLKKLWKITKIVFVTNNSTKSRREYAARISKLLEFKISKEDIVTSGLLVSEYLKRKGGSVYPIGEAGLIEELVLAGLDVRINSEYVNYVVVGLDRNLTFGKLVRAANLLWRGAGFIATNIEPWLPYNRTTIPGAGSIVSALSYTTGRKPDYVAGKPNPEVVRYVLQKYSVDKEEVLIIGDSLGTDIAMSVKAGVDSLLVLTGATRREEIEYSEYKPTYIAENLNFFLKEI